MADGTAAGLGTGNRGVSALNSEDLPDGVREVSDALWGSCGNSLEPEEVLDCEGVSRGRARAG